jgi:hypothetical protein
MASPRDHLAGARVLTATLGLTLASASACASMTGCRSKPTEGEGAPTSTEQRDGEGYAGPNREIPLDAGIRSRDAEARLDVDPDGPIDPACSGAEISFNVAVVDKRCAIGSARAKQLRAILERDGGPPVPLRQEAKPLADGRVALRLVNTGSSPLTLPLSFSAKLPAFSVLAEDDRHAIYELETPRFDVGPGGPEGAADDARPHFARIVLPAQGAALATVTLSPTVVRVLRAADAGAGGGAAKATEGGPLRLGTGHYVVHIGELLTDVEAGAPARVIWDLP